MTKLEELKSIRQNLLMLALKVGNFACPEHRQLYSAVDYLDDVVNRWRAEEERERREREKRAADLAEEQQRKKDNAARQREADLERRGVLIDEPATPYTTKGQRGSPE